MLTALLVFDVGCLMGLPALAYWCDERRSPREVVRRRARRWAGMFHRGRHRRRSSQLEGAGERIADQPDDRRTNWLDVPLRDYQATWEQWNAKQVAKDRRQA